MSDPFDSDGIRKSGLPCRGGCRENFVLSIDTVAGIGIAALSRNDHEVAAHRYHHVILEDKRPDFTKSRSRLNGARP